MKFRFRLDPMLKIADRKLKTLKSELNTVVSRRQTVEEMIEKHKQESLREDQNLASATGGREALLFFHHRKGRENQLRLLQERLQAFLNLEETLQQEIVSVNYEIHRLETAKDKARAKFKRELIKQEDKELDEIATLRYKGR